MARFPTATHWGRFVVETQGDELTAVRPFADDPQPSPIGQVLLDSRDPNARIGAPKVRASYLRVAGVGDTSRRMRGFDPYIEVSWPEALDLAAKALKSALAKGGPPSIYGGSYGWASAGRFHHAQSQIHRFLNCLGGYTGSVNTYSTAAAEVLLPYIVGGKTNLINRNTGWDKIARKCELFVAFGGVPLKNAQVTSGIVSRHSTLERMREARAGGTRFVNVGPMRDDIAAELQPEWIPIRPNSDTAMLLALGHELIATDAVDKVFLDRATIGFARLRSYILGEVDGCAKSPEWAAGHTGTPASVIRGLANDMSRRRTSISVSWSIQRAENGEQPYWLAIALASMLGTIGREGEGVGFGYGAFNAIGEAWAPFRWGSLPQGTNKVVRSIPVARVAEMLEKLGGGYKYRGENRTYPKIDLVYWAGGNPFHHHQDLKRLADAFRKPETVIVQDPFWTATARHADIVFPITTALERNDIACSSQDIHISPMRQALPPFRESRSDFDVFLALSERLGAQEAYSEGLGSQQWIERVYEAGRSNAMAAGFDLPVFSEFWAMDEGFRLPIGSTPETDFERFGRDPERYPLDTPSGRIELFCEAISAMNLDGLPGHPVWRAPKAWQEPQTRKFPLHLISNQPAMRLHSQFNHARASEAARIGGCEPLRIHPMDAAIRGIANHQRVRVFNGRGSILAAATYSDDIMRGVVQIATGGDYRPDTETGLDIGGNPNTLTEDVGCSELSQGPSPMSTRVEIEPM